jgi:hypothetical protein
MRAVAVWLIIERLPEQRQGTTEPSRWLDFNGALDYLGWTKGGKTRLYNLTSAEAIPFTKYGQRLYFDKADLDAYIETHRRGRPAAKLARADRGRRARGSRR